jgi:hypothetical protein
MRETIAGCTLAVLLGCGGGATEDIATGEVETYMVGEIEVRSDGNLGSGDPYRVHTITLELEPGAEGGKEYKYRLEEGRTMVYSWQSSGPVRTEMHSEADGQPDGSAEFFDVVPSGSAGHGTFTAPFPGIHGWYWENLSDQETVRVTLRSAGFYTYGVEFPGGRTDQLSDVHTIAGAE